VLIRKGRGVKDNACILEMQWGNDFLIVAFPIER
jgi:hypothetical protein